MYFPFQSVVDAVESEPEMPASKNIENVPFRAAPLSNKERLLLRKQALKMKRRPVLAVGNIMLLSFPWENWTWTPTFTFVIRL